jgi:hypothetical protein
MRFRLPATIAFVAILLIPGPASAEVELRIENGRIWLKAANATIGQILSEWSRLGQTQIVNGDRVPGGPVTLQLDNVTEEQALDVLLRSAAGFMGVRRTTPVAANSAFDRILILPRSSAAPAIASSTPAPAPAASPVFAPSAPPAPPPSFSPGVQRVLGPDGQPVPDDQDDAPRPPSTPEPPAVDYQPPVPFGQPPASPAGSTVPGMPVGVPKPGMPVNAPRPQNPTPDAR